MKQKIISLVEVFLELEDLLNIPDPDEAEKKDLDCALRDFMRLFRSLALEVVSGELNEVEKKIEELKNEKK